MFHPFFFFKSSSNICPIPSRDQPVILLFELENNFGHSRVKEKGEKEVSFFRLRFVLLQQSFIFFLASFVLLGEIEMAEKRSNPEKEFGFVQF